jgi:N-acetylated-alpha-linked acidic dipeptidase
MRTLLLRLSLLVAALAMLAPVVNLRAQRGAAPAARSAPMLKVPLGFSPQTYAPEERWEKRYLGLPKAADCGKLLRQLTAVAHTAGTPGDRAVSEMIYREFVRDGLDAQIVSYRVLLSYPKKITVDIVSPERVVLAHPEPPIAGDAATRIADPLYRMPWSGYSPSADLTLPVVYANYGTAQDYEQLQKLGISVRGKIVLLRYFHGYRGGKSLEAEKRGAAGVIVYSDPADDGAKRGAVYPHGPWGPLGHFQRGAVVYDFRVPGDPLTPGWASTPGARRIPQSESKILPKIPMVPLSAADAREILKRLGGRKVPRGWQGGLPFTYHVGRGRVRVHMALDMEFRDTPIWDVIGKIPGSEEPGQLVILSNHHDAWVYGAVDPSSGTAAMMETARALGQMLKEGFRPRRTIVLGSWDAEEYTLTGSTEWGEEHEAELRKNAVVCLNVDSATSGQDFTVSMVPALLPAVMEATQAVRDPATGESIYERWKNRPAAGNIRSYAGSTASGAPVQYGILGGGSDFMVFLQHDGVPSLDMIFDGPYGVYHSLYDDYDWMARYGDPGFRYHAAMSRLWGLLALRFANADLVPLDYSPYARELKAYLEGLKKIAPPDFAAGEIVPLQKKCRAWNEAAAHLRQTLDAWRAGTLTAPLDAARVNTGTMSEERALLNEGGIPGRPWFRHVVYAPLPSYEPETLPGLREALEAKDLKRAREQAALLSQALDRAQSALQFGLGLNKGETIPNPH